MTRRRGDLEGDFTTEGTENCIGKMFVSFFFTMKDMKSMKACCEIFMSFMLFMVKKILSGIEGVEG